MEDLRKQIEEAFEQRAEITPRSAASHVKDAVYSSIEMLDTGKARVAEKIDGQWVVNGWLKKAVSPLTGSV